MAEFAIQRININVTDTHTVGDVITTYWDDVAEDFVVKKNFSTITSGNDINAGTFTKLLTNYSFCDGNTLIAFDSFTPPLSFPYTTKLTLPDWPSCALPDPSPDLFIQISDIINESSSLADGQFTASAFSSAGTCEVSFVDFNYGDGNGNVSPYTFTGLVAGDYTVYARDQDNNVASKEVTIELGNDYGVLYRAEWDDLQGNTNRFDILEREYSGSITEVNTDSNPFTYNMNGNDINEFYNSNVKTSSCDITLISTTQFQYRDLFTQDERKYLGIWYLNINGAGLVERWRGYSIPSTFSEPYITTPYPTTITFTDGIAELSDKLYLSGKSDIEGEEKLIKVVSRILKNTGHELPIRVGVNMYSGSMTSAATDDPFDQCYVDNQTFYRGDEVYDPSIDIHYQEPFDCGFILNEILKPFGARFYMSNGYWWITRPEEERSSSYDFRQFDYNGDYVSNSSLSPNINISGATDTNRAVMLNNSGSYSIMPAYGELTVNNKLNPFNMVKNGGFFDYNINSPWYVFDNWLYFNNSGSTSLLQVRLNERSFAAINNTSVTNGNWKNDYLGATMADIEISSNDSIKFSFKYSYDLIANDFPFTIIKYRVALTLSGTTYYLTESGGWSDVAHNLREYHDPVNGFQDVSIVAKAPSGLSGKVTGAMTVRIYNYYAGEPEFATIAALEAFSTEELYSGYKTDVEISGSPTKRRFYELKEGSYTGSSPDIVEPDDYGTSNKYWELIKTWNIGTVWGYNGSSFTFPDHPSNTFFYIEDVNFQVLPDGNEPPEEERITVYSANYKENKEIELLLSDVGQFADGTRAVNDIYGYNDYFRLSDGSPITDWVRDGISESLTIQKILIKTLASQFSTPTSKISATFTTDEGCSGNTYIFPYNTLIETYDSNKVYCIDGMTFNSKMNEYTLELIELKELDTTTGGASAFSGDFNADFGNSFDTTYN